MDIEYVLTFKNTNFAIKAERFLLAEKLKIGVMPLPSQVSAGCGICLRVSEGELERALSILDDKHIGEVGLYSRTCEGGKYFYEEVAGV